jgi:glycosyltransferase involved in cell wall biosynthesis
LASRHAAPVYVVSNGFDPEDFPPVGYRRAPYFDVVYCGTIRRGSLQDPSPFFDALDAILSEGKRCLSRMRVRFYGISRARFARCLKGRPCGKLVQIIGHRPHDEITRIEQEASVLLLLTFPRSKGIMTSKIFEYLGAHRPILSVPGDRDVADALIKETNAGVVGRTPGEIVEVLLNWYKEWEETGTVQYGGLPDIIAHYTRENQAARMAQVLDEVCR